MALLFCVWWNMAKPKGDCVHLVRTINDKGRRIDIEPTMKRITVEGTRYTRTANCWIQYEDGKTGTLYMGDVPVDVFLEKSK